MSAKPWIVTVSVCGFVTAALAGIKFVQISQAMALMESFPPAYETVTVANAEADEWQPTRLLSGTVQSPEHLVISAETPGRIVDSRIKAARRSLLVPRCWCYLMTTSKRSETRYKPT